MGYNNEEYADDQIQMEPITIGAPPKRQQPSNLGKKNIPISAAARPQAVQRAPVDDGENIFNLVGSANPGVQEFDIPDMSIKRN